MNSKKIEEIKELPKDKKVEIMTQKESTELENILSASFIGFNKFSAGDSKNHFYIYETICSQCELGR